MIQIRTGFFSVLIVISHAFAASGQERASVSKGSDYANSFILMQLMYSSGEKALRGELQLDAGQLREVQAIVQEKRDADRAAFEKNIASRIPDTPTEGSHPTQVYAEMTNTVYQEALEELQIVLFPHQRNRLRQLALRDHIQSLAGGSYLKKYLILANKLGLSVEQKKIFVKTVGEAQKEYEKELRLLNEEFVRNATNALPEKGKKKMEEILGEFTIESPEFSESNLKTRN
jgi:hypothetical protein